MVWTMKFSSKAKIICIGILLIILVCGAYSLPYLQMMKKKGSTTLASAVLIVRKKINESLIDDLGHEMPEISSIPIPSHTQIVKSEIEEVHTEPNNPTEQSKIEVKASSSNKKGAGKEIKTESLIKKKRPKNQFRQNDQREPDPTKIIDFVMKKRTTKY